MIRSKKHELVRAAYLFYYASEVAFKKSPDIKKELGMRLNTLVNDALIIAKKVSFPTPYIFIIYSIYSYSRVSKTVRV